MRIYPTQKACFSSAMAAGFAITCPVHAQVAPVTGSDDAGQTADAGDTLPTVADIVVTARRRNELLQDVPIAVSAISAERALQTGITNTEALVTATPSLDFGRQSAIGATPFLRGVGTPQATAGLESPVAIYVDDVYIASPSATLFSLSNIESVQVLKGPQGTLFGRNATGGVIQVTTKKPSFTPSAEVSVGYGNYNTVQGSAYATGGLSENLAVNIAASGRKQYDGFGRSLLTGRETQRERNWDVRGQLLWQLGEGTKALLSADHSELRTDLGANSTVLPGTIAIGGTTFAGDFNTATAGTDLVTVKQSGVSLRIDHEASFADLVSISAYRYTDQRASIDGDANPLPFLQLSLPNSAKTFSQEFQIASKADSGLSWILGAYYFYSENRYDPILISGLFLSPFDAKRVNDKQKLNSFSGFGEVTYALFPQTNVTLGLRYTKDNYSITTDGDELITAGQPAFLVPGTAFTAKDSFPKLTYRAIVDHHFTSAVMGYASYSRGFKSGGFNVSAPTRNAVRPEVLDAFEVGLKTKFFNGNLTFNAAAFYYDYKDLIISYNLAGQALIANAASARIKGLDFDFVATPLRGLRISGGLGMIDGEYTSLPSTAGRIFTQNPNPPFGNIVTAADLSGNTTSRSPKLTFSVAPSYTIETGAGDITLAGSFYHNSGFFGDPSNKIRQPRYDLLNGSISWEAPNKHLTVRLWANNLTDSRYYTFFAFEEARTAVNFAAPRTYGVTLSSRF